MILVKPSTEIMFLRDGGHILERIESAGRTCYKSEGQISEASAVRFCQHLLKRGHESVIEHEYATVRFVVDRGVSHELVRHRLASYSQESTRYCNYRGGVTFVIPPWVGVEPGGYFKEACSRQDRLKYPDLQWLVAMLNAEVWYKHLLEAGWTPQQARSILPNSLKTEIVVTANMREWRHIFRLRCANAAHPQMWEVMRPLLAEFQERVPVLFDDICYAVSTTNTG